MLGFIAIDIDNTLTAELEGIPRRVHLYLEELVEKGWKLGFVTGRTFDFSQKVLKELAFPYQLAVYNGALILDMPSKKILQRYYLKKEVLSLLEDLNPTQALDFVVYAGYEHQDACFYRPQRFNEELLVYAETRQRKKSERWHPVESFHPLEFESFPSVKYFGKREEMRALVYAIEEHLGLHAPLCQDASQPSYDILQITDSRANKGEALQFLGEFHQADCLIAAGNDENDYPMLKRADWRVVMADAPQYLLDLADVIAPPASEEGIVVGLKAAIKAVIQGEK